MALLKPKDIASGMRPGHYVKLDSKGKLPPVDGSQLINLQLPKEEEIIERILEKLESEVSSRNFFRNPTGLSSPQEEPIEEEIELTFDEYETQNPQIEDIYSESTSHSELGRKTRISTPKFPNSGIDLMYNKGCQYEWHVTCPHCGKEQQMTFPENIINFFRFNGFGFFLFWFN